VIGVTGSVIKDFSAAIASFTEIKKSANASFLSFMSSPLNIKKILKPKSHQIKMG